MKKISIAIPCYNEEKNVVIVYQSLKKVIDKIKTYDFELIFIDNGSLDNTRNLIIKLAKQNKIVKGIFLSRNFGPEASGHACFDYATGNALIGISGDMQDPPKLIIKFIKKWEEGYDIVMGFYDKLDERLFMRIIRNWFYKIFNAISNTPITVNAAGFSLYDRKVITALKSLPEKYRFERGLIAWVGFKKAYIPYERKKRFRGKSSYSFIDYLHHSERGLFGFSYMPLDVMVYTGFLITILSFLFVIGYMYWVFVFGNPIKASIPLMLAIVFFGGIQLLAVSIIGKYIQVIVEETKNRPMYIVEDTINVNKKD